MFISVDPLADKKPHISPYAYCSNNPLNRIDPDGMDDYFNEQGKYLGSDYRESNELRAISQENWDKANSIQENPFISVSPALRKNGLLSDNSKIITFDEGAGEKFADLWDESIKAVEERAGLILFDFENAKVSFERVKHFSAGDDFVDIGFGKDAGRNYQGKTILGMVHTHVKERNALNNFSDKTIFNAQWEIGGDGPEAKGRGPSYSIGPNNVDYYSPRGKNASTNNIISTKGLNNNGSFILKHAFKQYNNR